MNILALDASTKSTGFALFSDNKLTEYGCLTASSTNKIKRIFKIIDELDKFLSANKIDKIILEEVRIEHGIQTKTYTALMYMQAAIMFLLEKKYNNIQIETVYPSEWRKKCGIQTGRGKRREAIKIDDIDFAQGLLSKEVTLNDDEADAIGIGWSYIHGDTNDKIEWE